MVLRVGSAETKKARSKSFPFLDRAYGDIVDEKCGYVKLWAGLW